MNPFMNNSNNIDDQAIILDEVLFDEIDEIQQLTQNMNFLLMKNIQEIDEIQQLTQNMNFLLMKNIQEKLMNYQNNTQIENLFLVNLILTIISVPILKFDPDLVICHSVLLDDDINSKYSILTVIKYIVQELSKDYLKNIYLIKIKLLNKILLKKLKNFKNKII